MNKTRLSKLAICISLISAMAISITFMRWNFHSDSAFYPLLAREQLHSGTLFPPGMCYSTELFVASPSILMIPFMAVIKDWLLARSLGICVLWAIAVFFITKAFVIRGDERWESAACACVLACMPLLGSELIDQVFLQAAYLIYYVHIAAFLMIAHYILCHREDFGNFGEMTVPNRWRFVLVLVGIALATIIPNLGGIRGLIQEALPFLVAFVILWLTDGETLDTLLHDKLYLTIGITWFLSVIITLVGYRALSSAFWSTSNQFALSLVSPHEAVSGVITYFGDLVSLYGQNEGAALVSVGGIIRLLNYLYAVLTVIVFPIYGIVQYKNFKDDFSRYLIIFCWVANLLLFAVSVSTGTLNLTSRYLIPTYFLNIILAVVCIRQIISLRTQFEGRLLIALVATYALISTSFFWYRAWPRMQQDTTHQTIVTFLREQDLEYGYATFWNAYVNTCFSNGDIEFVSFGTNAAEEEPANPTDVYRWLTNERWYEPEYHPGRCFILLRGAEQVQKKWYELASEILTCEDYTILIFERNINLY